MANMMDVIQRNSFRGVEDAKLFEVGNTFIPLQLPITEPPMEKSKLCIGIYGKYDFYDVKGIVEAIMSRFGITVSLVPIKDNNTFHPGRTAGTCARPFIKRKDFIMKEKSKVVLEFNKILDKVANYAETENGKFEVFKLEISSDVERVKYLQKQTAEALSINIEKGSPPLGGIYDVGEYVKRGAVGGIISQRGLLNCADTLRAARLLKNLRSS